MLWRLTLIFQKKRNISDSEKKTIFHRQWLKYSYVIGRIVQKHIWEFEGVWHPSFVNRFQDECPEIIPSTKQVYVFINNSKVDISNPIEYIINQCSRARNYFDTIGADFNDIWLERAYELALGMIAIPLLRKIYNLNPNNARKNR